MIISVSVIILKSISIDDPLMIRKAWQMDADEPILPRARSVKANLVAAIAHSFLLRSSLHYSRGRFGYNDQSITTCLLDAHD